MAVARNFYRCSLFGKGKDCAESRGIKEIVPLLQCTSDISSHLRFCNLSWTNATEYQLILARAGLFDLSEQQLLQMEICPRHRQRFGKYWTPPRTCQYPDHSGRKTLLHCKRPITMEIAKDIQKLSAITVPVGSPICTQCQKKYNLRRETGKEEETKDDQNTSRDTTLRAAKVKAMDAMQHIPESMQTPGPRISTLKPGRESTDWTPGYSIKAETDTSDVYEEYSFAQKVETLIDTDNSLESLQVSSTKGGKNPETFQLKVPWEKASVKEQKQCIREATEACRVVCDTIAPESGEKLFSEVCKAHTDDQNFLENLEPLMEAYKRAQTSEVKTQILSIYAFRYPANKLMEIHKYYEPITEWQLRKARIHARTEGPGAPLEKPPQHRIKLDMQKCDHFLEFVNRPYFHQDVAYGTRTMKLDSGEKLIMPNVIRTVTRSTMVAQYLQHCREEPFEPLSRSTLYRILEVREASQQKALRGLDNTAADGTAAFDTLVEIVEELERGGADLDWADEVKTRLDKSKRYLKTDYRVHCREESSPCADHCRVYSLSDDDDAAFSEKCDHDHTMQCNSCEALNSVLKDIEDALNNEEKNTFFSTEQQQDFQYDFRQAKQNIWKWKAHILRSENQERAKMLALKVLDESSAFITMDWAMKFQCQKYREKQSEWFGKRGMNWHVSSVVMKDQDTREFTVKTYVHIFDSCIQDWFAVVSILENLLETLKSNHPQLQRVYLKSDEAGCYHNTFTLVSMKSVEDRVGIKVERYDFSEPNHGKDICDRIICPMKSSIRRYCDEGHDIESAAAMREALQNRPVKGVTASVNEVKENQKNINVKKIPRFSAFHSFQYQEAGIRIWKAFAVGPGKLIEYKDIVQQSQGPTEISIKDGHAFFHSTHQEIKPKKGTGDSKELPAVTQQTEAFPCTEQGCNAVFSEFKTLQHHLDIGTHKKAVSTYSVYDKIRRDWAERHATIQKESTPIRKSESSQTNVCQQETPTSMLQPGWALSSPRTGGQRYSDKVKEYLDAKFSAGENTGRKSNPQKVAAEMRNARGTDNNRLFTRAEWLSRSQVQSYFSRLAAQERKKAFYSQRNKTKPSEAEHSDVEDWENEAESIEDETLHRKIRAEICNDIGLKHPIYYDMYNLCDMDQAQKLNSFNMKMLKSICTHFEVPYKSKDKKADLVAKVKQIVSACSCMDG